MKVSYQITSQDQKAMGLYTQRVFKGEDRVEPLHCQRCNDTGGVCMCGGNFLEAAPLKLDRNQNERSEDRREQQFDAQCFGNMRPLSYRQKSKYLF